MNYLEILRAKLATMRTERDAAIAEMEAVTAEAVAEGRSALTVEEDTAFVEARSKVDAIDADIDATEARIGELEAIEARQAAAVNVPQVMTRVPDEQVTDVRSMSAGEARDRAFKLLERRDDTAHLSTDQLDQVDRLIRSKTKRTQGDVVAKLLLLSESDDYRSAFCRLVSQPTPVLTVAESEAVQRFNEFRAMSIGTDTAGGFGVPVLIDPTIILTSQGSLNPFRRISRQLTITTDEWKGVSSAGVTWSYDAEASAVSDDSPTVAQPNIPVHMARGFIPYSIEVGMDYPSFQEEMSTLLLAGYDELQAESFATGSGSGAPTGIVTALDANTNVEVAVTTDGSLGAVDIRKVWSALPDRARGNATWVMSEDVRDTISSFGSAWGADSTATLADNTREIKNRPVEVSSYFADFTGTTGAANLLVVGDFSRYYIVDRIGMNVELVPHLFDVTNNRPTGQRGWFAFARHGADSVDDSRFRLLQNT